MFRNTLFCSLLINFLIFVWTLQTVSAQEQTEHANAVDVQETESVNPFFERLAPPDRTLIRRYDQAGRLIEAGRLAEAAQLLGSILEGPGDYFVQPQPLSASENYSLQTSNKLFSDLVLERLQGLPRKARESYSLQFEAQAQRLLENAVQNGAIEGIQQVSKLYFPTTAGATATFLLGMDQFEQGTYESAMLTLQRLNQSQHDRTSFEPLLSLTLANLQLRFQQENEARKTIEQLLKLNPNPIILLSGKETWKPQSVDEILTRLEILQDDSKTISTALWLEQTGWLLGMGTPNQNPETTAQKPLTELIWSVPILNNFIFNWEANSLLNSVRNAPETYIPAAQPLAVGNCLLTRGIGEITAVDLRTGKQLWTAPKPEYRISKKFQLPFPVNVSMIRMNGQNYRGPLRLFFWHDRITHQMSSDGSRLFTVDGLGMQSPAYAAWGRGVRNIQIGKKSVEDPRWGPGNTLVARNVKTGQTLWNVGKFPYVQKRFDQYAEELESEQNGQKKKETQNSSAPAKISNQETKPAGNTNENANVPPNENTNEKDKNIARQDSGFTEEEIFFSETWFLGAPLPFRGRLHVIGENGGIIRLIVLDAETGRLIRQQPLGIPVDPFEMDPLRKYYGLTPSASNGLILCPTGIGLVVAVDATTMTPVWCFSYRAAEKEDTDTRQQLRQRNRQMQFAGAFYGQNDEFRNLLTGWQVPALMIDKNRVLVAPPDDPSLYCLDLLTGTLLWQKKELKREYVLYAACIRNETAYLVTPHSMLALKMESGEPVWKFSLASSQQARPSNMETTTAMIAEMETETENKTENKTEVENKTEHQHKTGMTTVSETQPEVCFPHSLKPNGIGVHSGNRYFLPFTDGYLGIVDLDRGTMEWMSPQLHSQTSSTPVGLNADNKPESDFSTESFFLRNSNFSLFPAGREMNEPIYDSLLRQEITFGNLIGLRGRFFSQTPNQVMAFDQLEPLKETATNRLKENPNDSEGLLQLGRVRRAEGDIAESIALFRRSLQSRYSEYTADCLRKTLMEAIQQDYSAWSSAGRELETLAEFPEELGEILFVLIQCVLQNEKTSEKSGEKPDKLTNEKTDELADLLQKVFYLEMEHSVQVSVNTELSSQLHRVLGKILEQSLKNNKNPKLNDQINRIAETIFKQLLDSKAPPPLLAKQKWNENKNQSKNKNQFLIRPWWEQESMLLFSDTRRWQVFNGLFQHLPISGQAEKKLQEHYERHHFFSALELSWNFPVEWNLPSCFWESNKVSGGVHSSREPEQNQASKVSGGVPPVREPEKDQSSTLSESDNHGASPANHGVSPANHGASPAVNFDFEKTQYLATRLESQGNIADAVYYYRILAKHFKEQGQKVERNILEQPVFKKFYEREITAEPWFEGEVLIEDDPQISISRESPSHEGAVARLLRAAQPRNRFAANQQYSLPFLGSYEPFLSPYSYSLETIQAEVFLVCYDRSGEERWRSRLSGIYPDMTDYGFFGENSNHYSYGFSDQTVYLKGCNHLLLFVRENEMIAFDTFRSNLEESPKILWTKTLSSVLPNRQISGSAALENFQRFMLPIDRGFPKESVFVSPQVVCYRDADKVYGLNPMTGQTLWTRKIFSSSCSILGDRENLFLVFPDIQRVVAVDPLDGQELASGTIPRGGIFTFETNIVFLKYIAPPPGSNPSDGFHLYLSDLRELFQKRRRALIFTNDMESGVIPSIPTYLICGGLSRESMVRSIHFGRFLAFISWTSKTLRIYDLQTRTDILGSIGDWGTRTGTVLPDLKLRESSRRHDCDFDVELLGDRFLVYFTESGEVNLNTTDEVEDGVVFKRRRSPVVNVLSRPVGTGSMMLYDVDGKPCWSEPVRIEDWYRLLRVPPNVPVALFAAMFNEDSAGQPTISSTALLGIDKRTGKTRFRALIPPLQRPLLQGFRITADSDKQEISFLAPGRAVTAKFTNQTNPPLPKTQKH
ncbi:MAG: PQQ-binding-like beta-propeller repeat protein [Planctomycetaceae bacterium]|jgi:outer membrane protein assembly factor BamB/TolA-binding protein|nr:PQQ-binding-like beta-propeller repeat protein [Planctomycetaceae bacterium]